jgi:hypothetical protein
MMTVSAAEVQSDIRIDRPTVDGVPIDWCARWGRECGWAGADAFCRERGYARAIEYEAFNPGRTFLPNGNEFCTGASCTGFASVTCREARTASPPTSRETAPGHPPPPALHDAPHPALPAPRVPVRSAIPPAVPPEHPPSRARFDYPREAGHPIDWCRHWGSGCGWAGAAQFCRRRGYQRAVDWSIYRSTSSAVLGAQTLCEGDGCQAFRHVVCDGTPPLDYERHARDAGAYHRAPAERTDSVPRSPHDDEE